MKRDGQATDQTAAAARGRGHLGVAEPPEGDSRRRELMELGEELGSLAGHIAAATARFLALLGRFDQDEGWREWEMRSCTQWLSWRCGMDPRTAREHVRVARALIDLPLTAEAFARGEVSFSKVRAVSRVATAQTEADLLMLARHATAGQVERLCRGLRTAARTGSREAEETLAGEPLGPPRRMTGARWSWDEETGELILWGRFPAEEGAVLLAALTRAEAERVRTLGRAADALGEEPVAGTGGAEPEGDDQPGEGPVAEPPGPAPVTGPPGDPGPALVAMALIVLEGVEAPVLSPGAEVVYLHQSDPGSAEPPQTDGAPARPGGSAEPPACTTRVMGGPALPREDAGLVACTGHARDVVTRGGAVLSFGRRRRLASPAQVRALLLRDGGSCQAPGCGRTRFLHAHHVRYWSHGGRTDLDNLLLLCSACHALVHHGRLVVRARGGQRFSFHTAGGEELAPSPPLVGHADELLRGRRIEPAVVAGRWDGTGLDLSLATSGLLAEWMLRRHGAPTAA